MPASEQQRTLATEAQILGPMSGKGNCDNSQKQLDSGRTKSVHGNASNGRTLAIERVELTRIEEPYDPEAKAAVDRLLARWLSRAYLQRYGQAKEPAPQEETIPAEVA